jgi:hypothetical protein
MKKPPLMVTSVVMNPSSLGKKPIKLQHSVLQLGCKPTLRQQGIGFWAQFIWAQPM